MKQNIGKTDKIVRVVIALIAAYFGWKFSPWFYIITAICIITAVTGFCALYPLLGINTCEAEK